jgi:hypothetical protein
MIPDIIAAIACITLFIIGVKAMMKMEEIINSRN